VATRKNPAESHGPNRTALETTLEALRTAGRLELIDAARVAIARSLATAVDREPGSAILWREYRAAEKALREESEAHGDSFEQLIAQLSAPVRDETKPKTKNPRA